MKSGEGFLKWTPETIKAAKLEYERKLQAAFQVLWAPAPRAPQPGKPRPFWLSSRCPPGRTPLAGY